jgi:hypothetical protein
MSDVGPVTQQGVISTQVARVQNDRPTAVEPPRTVETAPPPPPPADSGRGMTVDVSA